MAGVSKGAVTIIRKDYSKAKLMETYKYSRMKVEAVHFDCFYIVTCGSDKMLSLQLVSTLVLTKNFRVNLTIPLLVERMKERFNSGQEDAIKGIVLLPTYHHGRTLLHLSFKGGQRGSKNKGL